MELEIWACHNGGRAEIGLVMTALQCAAAAMANLGENWSPLAIYELSGKEGLKSQLMEGKEEPIDVILPFLSSRALHARRRMERVNSASKVGVCVGVTSEGHAVHEGCRGE